MGMVGIGMAFVVGNLGTINHVIYAIDGAIGGPLCGLFFIGIFAPWVSTKVRGKGEGKRGEREQDEGRHKERVREEWGRERESRKRRMQLQPMLM